MGTDVGCLAPGCQKKAALLTALAVEQLQAAILNLSGVEGPGGTWGDWRGTVRSIYQRLRLRPPAFSGASGKYTSLQGHAWPRTVQVALRERTQVVATLDGTGGGAYGAHMDQMTEHLLTRAASVIRPQRIGDRLVGDVGCALLTDHGHVYLGVCLDTASGTGFCAEASAIAAMVTAGELRIRRIVAVWKDENAKLFVLSPCGRCREFIRQLHEDNLGTEIVLGLSGASGYFRPPLA